MNNTQKKSNTETFLEKALNKLKNNSFKLTKARTDILDVIANNDKALSPYMIQDILKEQAKKYSAITIYRVIETFIEIDIVHKVHSINSYMKCCENDNHLHRLLVCKNCHTVQPIESTAQEPHAAGFSQIEIIDEVIGLCEDCC